MALFRYERIEIGNESFTSAADVNTALKIGTGSSMLFAADLANKVIKLPDSALTIGGAMTVNNTIVVSSNATVGGILAVTGEATFGNKMNILNSVTVSGSLAISGTNYLYAPNSLIQSNAVYANDNIIDVQTAVDQVGSSQGKIVYVSPGTYGGSDLLITDKINMGIIADVPGNIYHCELADPRGCVISGSTSTRVKMTGLQIKGLTTINGTLGRHYFFRVNFNGGLTLSNSTTNWIIFESCDFYSSLTIPNTFAGTIYFVRCAFNGITLTLNQASPLQVIFTDCTGLTTFSLNATLLSNNYLTSGVLRDASTLLDVSSNATVGGTLLVKGAATISNNLNINGGNVTIGGNLVVTGSSTLANGSILLNSTGMQITGSSTINTTGSTGMTLNIFPDSTTNNLTTGNVLTIMNGGSTLGTVDKRFYSAANTEGSFMNKYMMKIKVNDETLYIPLYNMIL